MLGDFSLRFMVVEGADTDRYYLIASNQTKPALLQRLSEIMNQRTLKMTSALIDPVEIKSKIAPKTNVAPQSSKKYANSFSLVKRREKLDTKHLESKNT